VAGVVVAWCDGAVIDIAGANEADLIIVAVSLLLLGLVLEGRWLALWWRSRCFVSWLSEIARSSTSTTAPAPSPSCASTRGISSTTASRSSSPPASASVPFSSGMSGGCVVRSSAAAAARSCGPFHQGRDAVNALSI